MHGGLGPPLTSVDVCFRTASHPCCARPSTATQTRVPLCWTPTPTSTLPITLAGTSGRVVRLGSDPVDADGCFCGAGRR